MVNILAKLRQEAAARASAAPEPPPPKKKAGRPKGTVGERKKLIESTLDLRKRTVGTVLALIDHNSNKLDDWLARVAEDNPKQALDTFIALLEYAIPKLSRAESVNLNFNDNKHTIVEGALSKMNPNSLSELRYALVEQLKSEGEQ